MKLAYFFEFLFLIIGTIVGVYNFDNPFIGLFVGVIVAFLILFLIRTGILKELLNGVCCLCHFDWFD